MCGWYLDFCGVEVRHLGRLGLRGLGGRHWLGLFLLLGGHADVPGDRDRDRDRLGHTLGAGLWNGTSLYPPPAGEAGPPLSRDGAKHTEEGRKRTSANASI